MKRQLEKDKDDKRIFVKRKIRKLDKYDDHKIYRQKKDVYNSDIS